MIITEILYLYIFNKNITVSQQQAGNNGFEIVNTALQNENIKIRGKECTTPVSSPKFNYFNDDIFSLWKYK